MPAISYRSEVYRKLIHLSSLWMPLAIFTLPAAVSIILFGGLLAVLVGYEAVRRLPHPLVQKANKILSPIIRAHETTGFQLTGATYMVLAVLICCLLFPPLITATALCIMLIGDTAASLIGRRWGKTPLLGKSVEGTASFFAAGTIVILLLNLFSPFSFLLSGLIAVAVAAGVELISGKIHVDDNLSVTLAAAVTLWAL